MLVMEFGRQMVTYICTVDTSVVGLVFQRHVVVERGSLALQCQQMKRVKDIECKCGAGASEGSRKPRSTEQLNVLFGSTRTFAKAQVDDVDAVCVDHSEVGLNWAAAWTYSPIMTKLDMNTSGE
jgi:hypothetical protein